MTNNLQEPIKQEGIGVEKIKSASDFERKENKPLSEKAKETAGEIISEAKEEEISEKLETARRTIGAQKIVPAANVSSDAQSVANIQEFEKKIEKLVEIAVHQGPEHAIRVAQHMDRGKDPAQADNYTLDEIHDRLMEEELRKQLIMKGLLKEL